MFRTEIPFTPDSRQLSRAARVLTLGSCFADSIGSRLASHKVTTLVNPFGTVFNPLSATLLLRAAAGIPTDWAQHFVEARGRWQSYDLHGSIGAESAEALLARIQELVKQTADFVRSADVLALTLGTAWVYRLRETGELVSNCHKMPATLFEKELLTAEDIVGSLAETHALLRRLNPKLRFVLTVSPVRHLRDTLPLNSVSKGVLRLACHYLSDLLPDVSYFPAYELLTDDLRDYRFYAADMLHPSVVAEDYIWERFARTYFDADFGRFRKEWDSIRQALEHRPLHAGAPEHRQFLESTLEKLRRLAGQQVEVRTEIRDVERRLLALPPPPRPKPVVAPEPEDDEERIDIGTPEPDAALVEVEQEEADDDEPNFASTDVAYPETGERKRGGRNRGRGRSNRKPLYKEANPVLAESQPADAEAQPAVATIPVPAAPKSSYTDFLVSSALDLVHTAPATSEAPDSEATEAASGGPAENAILEEPVKKKKRRSRGGAKRTARKNAARLAAEQGATGTIADGSADTEASDEVDTTDSTNAENAEAPATDQPIDDFSEDVSEDGSVRITDVNPTEEAGSFPETLSSEAAPENQESMEALADGSDTTPIEADIPPPVEDARTEEATPDLVAAPARPKKRSTAPAGKKSKVIVKSAPVKRTSRRGPAPAAKSVLNVAAPSEATADANASADAPDPTMLPTLPIEAEVANTAAPQLPEVTVAPPADQSEPPAPTKRPAPTRPAKAKAAPVKSAKKTAPKPSRGKKGTAEAPSAAPASEATAGASPAADVPAATPAAKPAVQRRGRPPGTKKPRPNDPAAS
jgi:hypothetical protein